MYYYVKEFVQTIYNIINNENNNHIEKIIRQIEDANELYFVNPIAVIEYTNHYTDNKQNLIEIIDGHHRIKVLRKILKKHPNMKINFLLFKKESMFIK